MATVNSKMASRKRRRSANSASPQPQPSSEVEIYNSEATTQSSSQGQASSFVWYALIFVNIITILLSYANLTWMNNSHSTAIRGAMGAMLFLSSLLLIMHVKQGDSEEDNSHDN
ncbi:hypothetical protein L596_023062 [Steinernema carpocapsae]|uniref:Uncharacterized protein n=1 Tax=Steinernema carpocapsae TaxID=34508 RepID=A0A4U5MCH5_STECR|nr:hypothetical protein L596_023062 [Steinernema carpocapsae]